MLLNLIGFVLTPSNMITGLLVFGALLYITNRTRYIGCWVVNSGIILYLIAACGPFSYLMLGQLEHRYSPTHQLKTGNNIAAILVLAGYGFTDPYFPLSSRVNDATIFRTVEAARLWHQIPSATILLAGPEKASIPMSDLLKTFKIPDHAIQILPSSHSTVGNIRSAKPFLKNEAFVLVTSAGHMPRSILICHKEGLDPLPAPTDFYTSPDATKANLLPTPLHLHNTDLAMHEFLATLYLKINENRATSR